MSRPSRERAPPAHDTPAQPGADGPPRSGWDRYLSVLERHRISPVQREWYVRRAEAFVEAVRPTRMGEVSAEQVTGFFLKHARERRLTDWQFRQMVDAVQLLLVDLAQAPVASALDWDYWKEAGSGLTGEHPTVAARLRAEEAVEGTPRFAALADRLPLLKSLARTLRARRYAIRTEQGYLDWCHRFLGFCGVTDAAGLGPADVERFLAHLAADRGVSASTQNQVLNARVFLFREVLGRALPEMQFARARRPPRLPVVLTRDEVCRLIEALEGTWPSWRV